MTQAYAKALYFINCPRGLHQHFESYGTENERQANLGFAGSQIPQFQTLLWWAVHFSHRKLHSNGSAGLAGLPAHWFGRTPRVGGVLRTDCSLRPRTDQWRCRRLQVAARYSFRNPASADGAYLYAGGA